MKTTIYEQNLVCPVCGTELNRITDLDGDSSPKQSDLTLCFKCDSLLEWQSDQTLAAFDVSQLDPDQRRQVKEKIELGKKFLQNYDEKSFELNFNLDVEKLREVYWIDSDQQQRLDYAMPDKNNNGWFAISTLPIINKGNVEPFFLILLTDKTNFQFSSLNLFQRGKMSKMVGVKFKEFNQIKPFMEAYHNLIGFDNQTATELENINPVYGQIAKKATYSPGKANKPRSRSQRKRKRKEVK